MSHRDRRINQCIQHLIVPSCGDAEFRPDRGLAIAHPIGPRALEVKQAQLDFVELRARWRSGVRIGHAPILGTE